MFFYLLDLLGTTIFAVIGAYKGIKHGFNIWGVIFLGIITGLGGGTIREVLIQEDLPFVFEDYNYLFFAVIAAGITYFWRKCIYFIDKPYVFYLLDALALGVFAAIGAERAFQLNLGFWNTIIMGTITAVGGGLIRDTIVGENPFIFKPKDRCLLAVIQGIFLFNITKAYLPGFMAMPLCIFGCLIFRIIILQFKDNKTKFRYQFINQVKQRPRLSNERRK